MLLSRQVWYAYEECMYCFAVCPTARRRQGYAMNYAENRISLLE